MQQHWWCLFEQWVKGKSPALFFLTHRLFFSLFVFIFFPSFSSFFFLSLGQRFGSWFLPPPQPFFFLIRSFFPLLILPFLSFSCPLSSSVSHPLTLFSFLPLVLTLVSQLIPSLVSHSLPSPPYFIFPSQHYSVLLSCILSFLTLALLCSLIFSPFLTLFTSINHSTGLLSVSILSHHILSSLLLHPLFPFLLSFSFTLSCPSRLHLFFPRLFQLRLLFFPSFPSDFLFSSLKFPLLSSSSSISFHPQFVPVLSSPPVMPFHLLFIISFDSPSFLSSSFSLSCHLHPSPARFCDLLLCSSFLPLLHPHFYSPFLYLPLIHFSLPLFCFFFSASLLALLILFTPAFSPLLSFLSS